MSAKNMEATRYFPEQVRVVKVTDETPREKTLTMAAPNGNMEFIPGQFIQVSVFGYGEAPYTICSPPSRTDTFNICVSAVGNVSNALHRLSEGDHLGIRGPFGHGFPLSQISGRDLLFISGGTGLACLHSMIAYCRERRKDFGRLIIASGMKSPERRLFKSDLKKWHADPETEFHETVDKPDDTWQGRVGVVPDLIDEIYFEPEKTTAFVVGPPIVFRFAAKKLLDRKIAETEIHFSLERRFQCGVGKCGHCQLNDLYVCQNGPVFSYADLKTRSEAIEAVLPES